MRRPGVELEVGPRPDSQRSDRPVNAVLLIEQGTVGDERQEKGPLGWEDTYRFDKQWYRPDRYGADGLQGIIGRELLRDAK